MEIIKAIILGLIQGLTEFLPVSSSGHLVLFQNLFGMEEATQAFSILLHVATLVAVFIYYWRDIWELICHPFQRTTALLIAGTIPTVIIALLCNNTFDSIFGAGKYIGFNFIFTGLVLLYADRRKGGRKKIRNMSIFDSLVVGTMQGVAILPAVSRSGMTISTCLARGMDRENAARFSFLLSIPAILGGMVLTIKDMITGEVVLTDAIGIVPMAAGFIMAAVSGYFAIRFMVNIIKKGKLKWFSIYVFILGGVLIVDQFLLHMIVK
ncbi:undecaprenyl-diphosphate phosphatase [Anaerotignum sp. MB30-C6]|uniref:undecaprenyl-diphosphate phosphatase n=1 Tax=Anaerotignum sp. MB30-C6 TaxID=3070814 RepID=UPI0027DE8238|nr:undecaprenyl-diphosphate phosphatase [Anaerotignum sp. MB30-C6]WMI81967.1 undecaprenyl-diphosphate phosphatase [Anaerotignum sp. MB30-C6]